MCSSDLEVSVAQVLGVALEELLQHARSSGEQRLEARGRHAGPAEFNTGDAAGCDRDLGHSHDRQLPHLDLLGGIGDGLVDLISHDEVAELVGVVSGGGGEEGCDLNDAGGLFVVGDLVGTGEEAWIVLGDLGELVGGEVVAPDLGETIVGEIGRAYV